MRREVVPVRKPQAVNHTTSVAEWRQKQLREGRCMICGDEILVSRTMGSACLAKARARARGIRTKRGVPL